MKFTISQLDHLNFFVLLLDSYILLFQLGIEKVSVKSELFNIYIYISAVILTL